MASGADLLVAQASSAIQDWFDRLTTDEREALKVPAYRDRVAECIRTNAGGHGDLKQILPSVGGSICQLSLIRSAIDSCLAPAKAMVPA